MSSSGSANGRSTSSSGCSLSRVCMRALAASNSAVDAVADEFQRAQEAASSWRRAAAVRVGAERAPAEMSASAEKSVPARSLTTDVATGAWRRGSVTGAGAPRRVATKGEWLVIVRK
ncbi:hypothetical protein PR001_g2884 [Phytophthora rubi]|uniref:Uncharacterized protein n=1 Tax=Phytophthora rubi TaxID=129364 RepID=A0A6A3P7G0_9STRA|nr:hypothetical protein PR001_g2884 [Phytophthora rubi]